MSTYDDTAEVQRHLYESMQFADDTSHFRPSLSNNRRTRFVLDPLPDPVAGPLPAEVCDCQFQLSPCYELPPWVTPREGQFFEMAQAAANPGQVHGVWRVLDQRSTASLPAAQPSRNWRRLSRPQFYRKFSRSGGNRCYAWALVLLAFCERCRSTVSSSAQPLVINGICLHIPDVHTRVQKSKVPTRQDDAGAQMSRERSEVNSRRRCHSSRQDFLASAS